MKSKSVESKSADRLAAAVVALSQRGEDLTVRSLRREAGCSTDAAREYLAGMRVDDVPEQIPDLSAPVAALYGVAYSQASAILRSEYADKLATARQAEAESVEAAEAAEARARQAEERQQQATSEAKTLQTQLGEMKRRLTAAEQRADEAQHTAAEAERRAVDSAATARTLRDVLDTLHPGAGAAAGAAHAGQ